MELAALRLMGRLETLAWLAARIGLPVTPSVEFTHQHCRHGPAEGGPWPWMLYSSSQSLQSRRSPSEKVRQVRGIIEGIKYVSSIVPSSGTGKPEDMGTGKWDSL